MSAATAIGAAQRWWSRRPEVRFPLRFLVLLGAGILAGALLTPAWPVLTNVTARAVVWACNLVGISALLGAKHVVVFGDGTFSYSIIPECTAALLLFVYTAAILAYPASGRQRVIGLAVGVPVLVLMNLLRLVTLAWVGLRMPERFQAVHVFWWQGFLIAFVGFGWLTWIKLVVHRRPRNSVSISPPRGLTRSVATFVGAFGLLLLLGLGGGIQFYAKTVGALSFSLWGMFWFATPVQPSEELLVATFTWEYAILASFLALLLATPGIRIRRKVKAVLLATPGVAFLQVVSFILTSLPGGRASLSNTYVGSLMTSLVAITNVGLLVAAWFMWARKPLVQSLTATPPRRRHVSSGRTQDSAND